MHAEDLALRKGEVVAIAAVGQHPSGWWEGFTKEGRYGLVPKHGIEPLFDNESSESIGLGMMAEIPPDWRPVTHTPLSHLSASLSPSLPRPSTTTAATRTLCRVPACPVCRSCVVWMS